MGDVRLLEEGIEGHHKELVDGLPGPGFMLQVMGGDEDRVTALAFALFDERAAFEVGGEAEDGGWHGA